MIHQLNLCGKNKVEVAIVNMGGIKNEWQITKGKN